MFINEYFKTPIWTEEKPEFVKSLNKASDKYIKESRKTQKKYILVKTRGDHRICMSATILSLATGIKTKIDNFETDTSFPNFLQIIKKLGGQYYAKKS